MSEVFWLAIAGILATLISAFIGAYFAYLSKKSEHLLFVNRIFAERIINTYETLLNLISQGLASDFMQIGQEKKRVCHIFSELPLLHKWQIEFTKSWYTQAHYLDDKTLKLCRRIHDFNNKVFDEYPTMVFVDTIVKITSQDAVRLTEELRPLLDEAYESVKEYLLHKTQDIRT